MAWTWAPEGRKSWQTEKDLAQNHRERKTALGLIFLCKSHHWKRSTSCWAPFQAVLWWCPRTNWFFQRWSDQFPVCFQWLGVPTSSGLMWKVTRHQKKPWSPAAQKCLSKIAEDHIVEEYVKQAVLKQIDPRQFGSIPNSCSTHALTGLLVLMETVVQRELFRAISAKPSTLFDLIDHNVLVRKLF